MATYNLNISADPSACGEYYEFIGKYPQALSGDACKDIIRKFDEEQSIYEVGTDSDNAVFREDYTLDMCQLPNARYLQEEVQGVLNVALSNYALMFNGVRGKVVHTTHKKIQKTLPGGGYHAFHYEDGSYTWSHRFLTWMIYLNDITEGGETEFLYQSLRVKPTAGTLLIWPTGYTHLHRGNPPLSGNKYIVTGWYEHVPT